MLRSHMFHEGWQSHVEWFRQFTHSGRPSAEPPNDGPAGRIGKRLKDRIKRNCIVSHSDNYIVDRTDLQAVFCYAQVILSQSLKGTLEFV